MLVPPFPLLYSFLSSLKDELRKTVSSKRGNYLAGMTLLKTGAVQHRGQRHTAVPGKLADVTPGC